MKLHPERQNIQFNTLRNALYHTSRRRFFERWNKLFNLVVILLGTATAADLASTIDVPTLVIGGATALVGSLQLVFDLSGQARTHQVLQRDYYGLLADIERTPEASAKQVAEWRARQALITADEPPTLRAIDAKAYNDAMDALELRADERLVVPFFHRLTGQFIPFEGRRYLMFKEHRPERMLTN